MFSTSFILDTTDPATGVLEGTSAVDNYILEVLLNGVSQGISNVGFTSLSPFVITSGFVGGSNTLDIVVSNSPPPGPIAVRLEWHGVAMPLVDTAPEIVSDPVGQSATEGQDVMFDW